MPDPKQSFSKYLTTLSDYDPTQDGVSGGGMGMGPQPGYDAPPMGSMGPGGQMGGFVSLPNQNAMFMQWLFSFKQEVTLPLRYLWRGYEQDERGIWIPGEHRTPLMNEKGITWAISLIESYINPVYVVSNYKENDLNWTMRQIGRVVYNNLCSRYHEFEMNKLDITRVGNEIISKVHAILLGALNNGYRQFLSTTYSNQEVISKNTMNQQGGGILPNIKSFMFRDQQA